jgi:hypothetical protein
MREVAAYLSDPPLLVLLSQSFLSTLDLSARKPILNAKVPLEEQLKCGDSAYAVLDRSRLLCCGGNSKCYIGMSKLGEAVKLAFTIDIATGHVTCLCDMNSARDKCGLIVYRQVAYVFGGNDLGSSLTVAPCAITSEALSLSTSNTWESMANMSQPRWSFSPCLWKAEIYLCDAFSTDIFRPESRSFQVKMVAKS